MVAFSPAARTTGQGGGYTLQTLTVHGHAWPYCEAGNVKAPAVVLLPGALGRPETNVEYIAGLKGEWHVITPGYPATLRRLEGFTDGIAQFLTACGVARAHVVGGSFGGLIAQALWTRHPDRVKSLILSDTSPPTPRRVPRLRLCAALLRVLPERLIRFILSFGVGRYVAALPPDSRRFWTEHFAEMRALLTMGELQTRARVWAEFDSHDWSLPAVSCPALILCARSDRAVSPRAFARHFPRAEVEVIASPFKHAASIADTEAYLVPMRRFLRAAEVQSFQAL